MGWTRRQRAWLPGSPFERSRAAATARVCPKEHDQKEDGTGALGRTEGPAAAAGLEGRADLAAIEHEVDRRVGGERDPVDGGVHRADGDARRVGTKRPLVAALAGVDDRADRLAGGELDGDGAAGA